jgi:hypothetical protein
MCFGVAGLDVEASASTTIRALQAATQKGM